MVEYPRVFHHVGFFEWHGTFTAPAGLLRRAVLEFIAGLAFDDLTAEALGSSRAIQERTNPWAEVIFVLEKERSSPNHTAIGGPIIRSENTRDPRSDRPRAVLRHRARQVMPRLKGTVDDSFQGAAEHHQHQAQSMILLVLPAISPIIRSVSGVNPSRPTPLRIFIQVG